MHADRFLSLVKNATDLRPEELAMVRKLAGQYPYSQLLQLLVARGSRDQKGADAQAALHLAAVYATDRAVLKRVMTLPVQPRVEADWKEEVEAPPKTNPAQPTPTATGKPAQSAGPAASKAKAETGTALKMELPISPGSITLEGDALREDLKKELTRLQQLMGAFDAAYEQVKSGEPYAPPAKTKKTSPKAPPTDEAGEAPLIEEIKHSKRKPKLVSPKVAEQGEIIDQFIKVAPTLPRTKPAEPGTDLSVESVNYGDNIVSETLVEILLKQGKKDKAIEMLKKLIWKFPQKKAYFAAQIEALKS